MMRTTVTARAIANGRLLLIASLCSFSPSIYSVAYSPGSDGAKQARVSTRTGLFSARNFQVGLCPTLKDYSPHPRPFHRPLTIWYKICDNGVNMIENLVDAVVLRFFSVVYSIAIFFLRIRAGK